ncbi:PIN domain-containing protein [Metallumcola ferriviriculae]|uniref:PIN domain-containing protein n=1 Tax=Metallumcola ferriviriculae TaxID=3039180 RepID=A0AAU0US78_9FIRM|nr:PIN domain-containing protein [Desulfitibacteraceae bacterium MK1]
MKGKSLQFIDTNIIIYAYNRTDEEKHNRAKALMKELWEEGQGCLSIQVLQEFYVNITRKLSRPMPPETAAQIIGDLGQWDLHVPEMVDVLETIGIQKRNKISFWDAMIVCSAKSLACDILWTEDLNNGQYCEGVKVQNPFL